MARLQQVIAVLVVLISLGLGWYAWVLGQRAVKPQAVKPAGATVVVAAKALPAGAPIGADGLRSETMALRPEGAFEQAAAVVGKVPAEALVAGEPVLAKRLLGEGAGLEVRSGERAVAVRVDEVSGVANRLQPRHRVDVFVVLRRTPEEVGETQARLLLPDVQVLAVGARGAAGREEGQAARAAGNEPPRTVVLAVHGDDVSRLLVAAETGRLLLALRSASEAGAATLTESERPRWLASLSESSRATLRAISGGGTATADGVVPAGSRASSAPRPAPAVEIIRGTIQGDAK
jgi:pilus assembly protein CpaB